MAKYAPLHTHSPQDGPIMSCPRCKLDMSAPDMLEALEFAADILDMREQAAYPMAPPSPELQRIREVIIAAGGTPEEE